MRDDDNNRKLETEVFTGNIKVLKETKSFEQKLRCMWYLLLELSTCVKILVITNCNLSVRYWGQKPFLRQKYTLVIDDVRQCFYQIHI